MIIMISLISFGQKNIWVLDIRAIRINQRNQRS